MLAASEDELRPFVANLRCGRPAVFAGGGRTEQKFECLKTAGYRWTMQRTTEGAVTTFFLPDLFCLDPGMVDPKGVGFVVLPPKEWLAEQDLPSSDAVAHVLRLGYERPGKYADDAYPESAEEHLAALTPVAALWCAYLDRRTRCPLIADTRWYLQVLVAALERGIAQQARARRYDRKYRAGGFHEHGVADVGLVAPVLCHCSHEVLEAFLAEQVATYFGAVDGAERRAA